MRNKIFNLDHAQPDLYKLNDFVNQAADIDPGAIQLSRADYSNFILNFSNHHWLPIIDKPYTLHIPTAYGLLPVTPTDNIQEGIVAIVPKVDVDAIFEKVILK